MMSKGEIRYIAQSLYYIFIKNQIKNILYIPYRIFENSVLKKRIRCNKYIYIYIHKFKPLLNEYQALHAIKNILFNRIQILAFLFVLATCFFTIIYALFGITLYDFNWSHTLAVKLIEVFFLTIIFIAVICIQWKIVFYATGYSIIVLKRAFGQFPLII